MFPFFEVGLCFLGEFTWGGEECWHAECLGFLECYGEVCVGDGFFVFGVDIEGLGAEGCLGVDEEFGFFLFEVEGLFDGVVVGLEVCLDEVEEGGVGAFLFPGLLGWFCYFCLVGGYLGDNSSLPLGFLPAARRII